MIDQIKKLSNNELDEIIEIIENRKIEKQKKFLEEIDFVIKTFKRYSALNNMLISIQEYYPKAHITIADDNEVINHEFYNRWKELLDITLIEMPFDSGLSAGRNQLVKNTKRKYILLLDDDFEFYPATDIEGFYNVLEFDKEAMVVGGTTIKNRTTPEHYEFDIEYKDRILTKREIQRKPIIIKSRYTVFKANSVLNFALFRRELFDTIRWDDELKIAEHMDFYFNFFIAGFKALFMPQVKIFHMKESNKDYKKYRKDRAEYFIKLGLVKNGIKKMIDWNGNSYEVIDSKLIIKKEV